MLVVTKLLIICFFPLMTIQDVLHAYSWGCNVNSFCGHSSPNPGFNSTCDDIESYLLIPKIINPSVDDLTFSNIDICYSQYNTIIFTEDKKRIYAYGSRNGIISANNTISTVPVMVFNGEYDGYGCGFRNAYIWKWDSFGLYKSLRVFGDNKFGNLGVGHLNAVSVPTLISSKFEIFSDSSFASAISDGSNIKTAGSNIWFAMGRDKLKSYISYSHVDIQMNGMEVEQESSTIKDIIFGSQATFVIWESNNYTYNVYFWGANIFSTLNDQPDLYTKLPVKCIIYEPYTDIPQDSKILQISVHMYVSFLLVEVGNVNRVYSWGAFDMDQVYVSGRPFDGEFFYKPKEIFYGEINIEGELKEKIIAINTGFYSTFFLTNKKRVYVLGRNKHGVFPPDTNVVFGFTGLNIHPKRILSSIKTSDYQNVELERTPYSERFLVKYWKKRENDYLTVLLIVGGVIFGVFLIIFVIGTVVFIILLILFKLYYKGSTKHVSDTKNLIMNENIEFPKSVVDFFDDNEFEIEQAKNSLMKIKLNKSLFKVDPNEVKLTAVLGKGGSNSTVYKGVWYGKEVAVKLFNTSMFGGQRNFDEFEREVNVSYSISHPNIVQFYGACLEVPRVMLLMEYASGGDLQKWIGKKVKSKTPIVFETKVNFIKHIVSAVRYLHEKDIVHRDLKLKNIMITSKNIAKIIDFGLSRSMKNVDFVKKTKKVGTSMFMSPEIVLGTQDYDEKTDIFSLGIIFFMILTDEPTDPYRGIDELKKIGVLEISVAQDPNLRPSFTEKNLKEIDCKWIDLCKKCWKHNQDERPNITQVFESI